MFLAYATGKGRTLLDRELYLSKSWTGDRERCAQAGIPQEREFATKQVLARQLLARALEAGVPAGWVTADEAYGKDFKFRVFLESYQVGYVVAAPKSQATSVGSSNLDPCTCRRVAADAPPEAWKRLSAGDGAKGPQLHDWAMATLPIIREPYEGSSSGR